MKTANVLLAPDITGITPKAVKATLDFVKARSKNTHILAVSNEHTGDRLRLKSKINQLPFEDENIENEFATEKLELEDIISGLKLENRSMRIELQRKFVSLDRQLAEKMWKIENQKKEISELKKPDPRYECKVCQEQVPKYIYCMFPLRIISIISIRVSV